MKVIRNHETQESKGFAFVEAPTADEMQSIIRRFDRAPLEDRLLRANAAQPPKGKDAARGPQPGVVPPNAVRTPAQQRPPERRKRGGRQREQSPRSAFANELAKAL